MDARHPCECCQAGEHPLRRIRRGSFQVSHSARILGPKSRLIRNLHAHTGNDALLLRLYRPRHGSAAAARPRKKAPSPGTWTVARSSQIPLTATARTNVLTSTPSLIRAGKDRAENAEAADFAHTTRLDVNGVGPISPPSSAATRLRVFSSRRPRLLRAPYGLRRIGSLDLRTSPRSKHPRPS